MELRIDPTNPEEVSAALRMLEVMRSEAVVVRNTEIEAPAQTDGTRFPLPLATEFSDPMPEAKNAAAVFQTAPLHVPDTAAAEVFGTVPAVMPGSLTVLTAPTMPAPPPAPQAIAPTEPAAPLNPAPGVELDSKGMPWDDRIHASTKTKISDGSWKAKRGVEPALLAQVTAELKGGAPLPPAVPAAPAPTQPQVAWIDTGDPTTFAQIMPRLTAASLAGTLTAKDIGDACAAHGLASIVALQSNEAVIPLVWATLQANHPRLQ